MLAPSATITWNGIEQPAKLNSIAILPDSISSMSFKQGSVAKLIIDDGHFVVTETNGTQLEYGSALKPGTFIMADPAQASSAQASSAQASPVFYQCPDGYYSKTGKNGCMVKCTNG